MTLTAALAAALLTLAPTTTAALRPVSPTPGSDMVYCVVQDSNRRMAYYSGVFAGDYFQQQSYRQSFHAFVDARYGETSSSADAYCFYEASFQQASDAANSKAVGDQRDGYSITWTRWTAR